MELDDLRRQWQQPEPVAPPALTGHDLDALLKGRTLGLVEKMRRNAWLEISLTVVTVLALLIARPLVQATVFPRHLIGAQLFILVGLLLVMLLYYYRLLGVLKRMLEPADSVQRHLHTLAQGLRQLLRFYYYLTIWSGPVVLAMSMGYYVGYELGRPGAMRWIFLAGLAAALLVGGGLAQMGTVYFTRWYMQRLYGRHLDRLEGQLRELNEDVAAD